MAGVPCLRAIARSLSTVSCCKGKTMRSPFLMLPLAVALAAGCAKSAVDVYTSGQSSTAAALKAIQIAR